jgi:hypothetical protein
VLAYTAEPGSPAQDALNLLASWTATSNLDLPHSTRDAKHEVPSPETE